MGGRILDLAQFSARRSRKWIEDRGGSLDDAHAENKRGIDILMHIIKWMRTRTPQSGQENDLLQSDPFRGRCDSLGRLKVVLPTVSPTLIEKSSLVMRSARKQKDKNAVFQNESQSQPVPHGVPAEGEEGKENLGSDERFPLIKYDTPAPVSKSRELMDEMRVLDLEGTEDQAVLELPVFVGEYKRLTDIDGHQAGTNQMRMYLTASVKYLEAVGITGIPVYGVQTEGSIAAISAAMMKGEVCIPIVLANVVQK